MKIALSSLLVFLFGMMLVSCDLGPDKNGLEEITLTILYTNDEHGWIEESSISAGAARLMGLWTEREGYTQDGSFLALSGGDNWTGPAISTWFEGEPVVAVMNAMGYDATAIGNHEFDFQVSGLLERIDEAEYPFLSANIRTRSGSEIPDFATPYVIVDVQGLQVGIIGLTTVSTSYSTFPAYVEDYDFIDYGSALEEWVPRVWDDGADIVLLIAHICYGEMIDLIPLANTLGISMIGGGHCNDLVGEVHGDIAIIEGGSKMAAYARLDILYNFESETIDAMEANTLQNDGSVSDPAVAAIVSEWQGAVELELGEVIGYVEDEISRYSAAMHNLVTDSWLIAVPSADIAMTNSGGIRQPIPQGDITKGTIVGVLPFTNQIIELELLGSEVVASLGDLVIAGMTTIGGYKHMDGSPLIMDSLYHVLTTDYLYLRDDMPFAQYDTDPYYTGLIYHQPTVDYLIMLNTSASDPLDNYLDHTSRR